MTLMTGEQYVESLRKMKRNIYLFGEKVEDPVNNPIIRPSLNCLKLSYELALDPEYEDLMTETSHLTGKRINRFNNINVSVEQLIKKTKMQRLMGSKTGSCFQRCIISDGGNAIYSTTHDIDKKNGTNYHERFKKFMIEVQDEDLIVGGALTDPKGDRSIRPKDQEDKDIYLRVVERRKDGVVINGAKAHLTGITNSHYVLILPTQALIEGEEDYAIVCAVPLDAPGVTMIVGRQSCDTRKLEDGDIDVGNSEFGGVEALTIFDNVFIPNDKIFLNGEVEFVGDVVTKFAAYHRNSYGGCKVGVGDVLIGAASLISHYNGTEQASHIKDKLIEMTHLNETLYACGVASAAEGSKLPAGNYYVDSLLANVCKQNVTRFPYEITRIAEDIAGGIMVTAPSEQDLRSKEIGHYIEKYLIGKDSDAETRLRCLRLLENLTLGTAAVGYRTESMHGAGSPQSQRIMIQREGNIVEKRKLAKNLAKINK